jgi:purine-nucleoside phosphorylase
VIAVGWDPYVAARDAARVLAERTGVERHHALVVLGSGWAGAADALGRPVAELGAADLPGFIPPVAPGHAGRILSIRLGDVGRLRALVVLGRTHLYEGRGLDPVVHLVRTAAAAGCRTALLTNASGALRPDWPPGTGVVLRDHLNLAHASPLTGPRFVDLTDAYSPRLRTLAHAAGEDLTGGTAGAGRAAGPAGAGRAAAAAGAGLREGVYAMLRGPQFETVAEARMLRALGADLVGMSTVPEVIAARELGLEVLALSVVASVEPLVYGVPGVDADEVVRVAAAAAARLGPVLATVLTRDAADHSPTSREAHDGD